MHKTLGIIIAVSLLVLISWFGLKLYNITSQPSLKLNDNIYTVVNCEQPRDEHANMVCPYLYCNKALLESGEIPEVANISRSSADNTANIEGIISYTTKENAPVRQRFQCQMQDDRVINYKILALE